MPRGSKSKSTGDDDDEAGGGGGGFLKSSAAYVRERRLKGLRKKITEIESKIFDISVKRERVNQQLADCNNQITALSQEIINRRALLCAAQDSGKQSSPSSSASGSSSSSSPTLSSISSSATLGCCIHPLPTACSSSSVPLGLHQRTNSPSQIPVRRFVIGGVSSSATSVILALPQHVLRNIAIFCDQRTRAALACTCRKFNWVVSDPSVAGGDTSAPCKPYPEGAPWAAPPLFCMQPQTTPTQGFLSSRGGTAAAATALAQQKIRSQIEGQGDQQQPQQDQQVDDSSGQSNRRRLKRTQSRHQDMGLMLALNLNPSEMRSSNAGVTVNDLLSDHVDGDHSLDSSPLSAALESPIESLSDSESTAGDVHARSHIHRVFRGSNRSEGSSEYSDGSSSLVESEILSHQRTNARGSLYMNPGGASPKTLAEISPRISVGGTHILRRNIEPTSDFEKICLVGDSSVGKSTIADILEFGTASGERKPTLGFSVRAFSCIVDNYARFDVQLYDISGSETRPVLLQPFFADAGAVVLCYSVSSRSSLLKLLKWISFIRQTLPGKTLEPPLFMIGLKSDTQREVQIEEVSLISVNTGASYLGEVNHKQVQAIEEAFCRVASCVYLNTQFRRFKNEVCK